MKRGVILAGMAVALIALCACVGRKPVQAETVETVETPKPTSQPVRDPYLKKDITELRNTLKIVGEYEPSFTEPEEEPEEESELVYLGTYVCTAYCSCPVCVGENCGTCTASGTVPEEGRTVACNNLPFGTVIMVDGHEYIVEDTGFTPYGDNWLDFYFWSHDQALEFGVQEKEVYMVVQ